MVCKQSHSALRQQ